MRNHIAFKFIAVLLCALSLLGLAAAGLGFFGLGMAGLLGSKTFEEVYSEQSGAEEFMAAWSVAHWWANNELGGMPDALAEEMLTEDLEGYFDSGKVSYIVTDAEGNELLSNYNGGAYASEYSTTFDSLSYEKVWEEEPGQPEENGTVWETYPDFESGEPQWEEEPESTEEVFTAAGEAGDGLTERAADAGAPEPAAAASAAHIPEHTYSSGFFSQRQHKWYEFRVSQETAPVLNVRLLLAEGARHPDPGLEVLHTLWNYRMELIWALLGSGLLFAVFAVYLCSAAGRKPGAEEIRAAGLNAVPLDLYGLVLLGYLITAVLAVDEGARYVLSQGLVFAAWCGAGLGFGGCLIFVGFCFAFVAQIKMSGRFWLHNLLCVRCGKLCWNLLVGILTFCFGLIPKGKAWSLALIRWCWSLVQRLWKICIVILRWMLGKAEKLLKSLLNLVGRLLFWCGKKLERFFSLLPMTWQWLLTGLVMVCILALSLTGGTRSAILGIGICALVVLYGAEAFGTLLEGTQKMRSGDLEAKIEDKFLVGSFKDFSGELNGLADVAVVAAQKQLKSERMKTELITNVSHDIKTPLTSIINYVDLLAKPHTPEEEKTYLEVLSRQSARMKKLIEDLIEMSKASSGNIAVEIDRVDAAETVNQALGEFSDKLEAAGLTPVFHAPEQEVFMLADGRLVWRAMSNVLSNAVKYALPGTRLYVDVAQVEDKVILSMKNISRAELNVSAEELLERFVRGDTSRNTEGSGLGLNIAKSLMELQHGQLQLLVDGDLFKVTMIFPKA